MITRRVTFALTALLAPPAALQAQMAGPAHFASWRPAVQASAGRVTIPDGTTSQGSGSGMVLGGIGGTVIGWLLGGALGAVGSDGSFDGAIYGAMVGATAGVPVGVHFGNHGQGSLGYDLLVSAGIGAAGIALTSSTQSGLGFVLTPLAQLIAAIALEDHAVQRAAAQDTSQ